MRSRRPSRLDSDRSHEVVEGEIEVRAAVTTRHQRDISTLVMSDFHSSLPNMIREEPSGVITGFVSPDLDRLDRVESAAAYLGFVRARCRR